MTEVRVCRLKKCDWGLRRCRRHRLPVVY